MQRIAAIGCGDGTIRIFDLESVEEISGFDAHDLSVNAVLFHPHQDMLISGGRDAHISIWDTLSWKLLQSIPAHNYAVYSICYHEKENLFFTASRDRTIKIWGGDEFNFLKRIEKENLSGHAFSVNKLIILNELLISGSDDKKISGWKITTGEV
jgi:WD40 repeat protein